MAATDDDRGRRDADDHDLLTRWRAGDNAAGDTLFVRHFTGIHRFFRTKLQHDIDDLVQRTFMALLEVPARGREIRSVRAWLFGTARNLLLEHLRRRAFDPATSSLADVLPSPSTILAEVAEQRLLAAAVRRIPFDQQVVLELYYWEEMTGAEIAACLGEPQGTIRGRLRRARQQLQDALAEVADSPELVASTLGDLDRWIASLREQVASHAPARRRRAQS